MAYKSNIARNIVRDGKDVSYGFEKQVQKGLMNKRALDAIKAYQKAKKMKLTAKSYNQGINDFVRDITKEIGEITRKEFHPIGVEYTREADFGEFKFVYTTVGLGDEHFIISYKGKNIAYGTGNLCDEFPGTRGEWKSELEDLIKNKDEIIVDYKAANASLLRTKEERQKKVVMEAYERAVESNGKQLANWMYEQELKKGLISPLFGEYKSRAELNRGG